MAHTISNDIIESFKQQLENHPVYEAVDNIDHLRIFMQHHIYSVWDFMSLLKYLQRAVAPASVPWVPVGDGDVRRFINELVLEEESDEAFGDGSYSSHFELYQVAMREIGADTGPSERFVDTVIADGVSSALALPEVPSASVTFTTRTFAFIDSGKAHTVAAALALGREHIIPCMFRAILQKTGVDEQQAPIFHYYLNRHVDLDEGSHAPLSLRLLNGLCDNNESMVGEAIEAAREAVEARLQFWDGVLEAINAA